MSMSKRHELGKMIGVTMSLVAAIGSAGCSIRTENTAQPNNISIQPYPSELPKSLHSNLSINYTGNDAQLSFEAAGKTYPLVVHCIRPGYVTFKPEDANDLSEWGAELHLCKDNKITSSDEPTLRAFVEQPEARTTLMGIVRVPLTYN